MGHVGVHTTWEGVTLNGGTAKTRALQTGKRIFFRPQSASVMTDRHRNSSNTLCWCCSPCPPPAPIHTPGKSSSTWGKYLLLHTTVKLWGGPYPTQVWAGTSLLLEKAESQLPWPFGKIRMNYEAHIKKSLLLQSELSRVTSWSALISSEVSLPLLVGSQSVMLVPTARSLPF